MPFELPQGFGHLASIAHSIMRMNVGNVRNGEFFGHGTHLPLKLGSGIAASRTTSAIPSHASRAIGRA
jgi:hypothetical protein